MTQAESNTQDVVRALALRIVRYEELLRLLSSVGDTLREGAERKAAGQDDDLELAVVARVSDALGAAVAPNRYAFYCARWGFDARPLDRVVPGETEDFPAIVELPDSELRDGLEPIPLEGGAVGLAYWHRPEGGRKWALVLRPTETGYIDPTASFSIKLFGDCLAGITSAARAQALAARAKALEGAMFRVLDEQKVVLSVEVEGLRRAARELHLVLGDLEQVLQQETIDRETCKRLARQMREARTLFSDSTANLSQSVRGLGPDFLDTRGQLEPEQDVRVCEILVETQPTMRDQVAPWDVWVRTQPRVVSRAIKFLQGTLYQFVADIPAGNVRDDGTAGPALRAIRDKGQVHIDIAFTKSQLPDKVGDVAALLLKVLSAEAWAAGDVSLMYPPAFRAVLDYLDTRLKIATNLLDDDDRIGVRLTIPAILD